MDELETRTLIKALKGKIPSCEGHVTQEVMFGLLELIDALDERITELQAEEDC